MRESIITHPADTALVLIREDYLAICEGNHCAAALLNIFEYWTNVKRAQREQAIVHNQIASAGGQSADQDTELWVYKSQPDLQAELLNLFGLNKIGKGLAMLVNKQYLQTRHNPKYPWDRTLQYLFDAKTVQEALDKRFLKLMDAFIKNKASKSPKQVVEYHENKGTIPEITPENTSDTDAPIHDDFEDFEDETPKLYPCTEKNINELINMWWEWVPKRPTRRGKIIDASAHFANTNNREYARNLYERGVRAADFAECLGLARNHPPDGGHKEMTFAYAARIVEAWVERDRRENFYTSDCPRITARKPGVVIDVGDLTDLSSDEIARRNLEHPDLIIDAPPPYISPHRAAELEEDDSIAPLDASLLEGMPAL